MLQVLEEISKYHASESGRSWMGARYRALLAGLASGGRYANVSQGLQVHSIELVDAVTGQLVAGEVGHSIGRAHISLTLHNITKLRLLICSLCMYIRILYILYNLYYAFCIIHIISYIIYHI
jgi:hypothetical protein